jgi:hypothetical protein
MYLILFPFTEAHKAGNKNLQGVAISHDLLIIVGDFSIVNKISLSILAKMPDYFYTCISYSFFVLFLVFKSCIQHQF